MWVLKDKHWLTSAPHWTPFLASYTAAVSLAWIAYVKYHSYEVFTTCFTLQVILAALISLATGPVRLRALWLMFLGRCVGFSEFMHDIRFHPVQEILTAHLPACNTAVFFVARVCGKLNGIFIAPNSALLP